jgi:hypothetical protein
LPSAAQDLEEIGLLDTKLLPHAKEIGVWQRSRGRNAALPIDVRNTFWDELFKDRFGMCRDQKLLVLALSLVPDDSAEGPLRCGMKVVLGFLENEEASGRGEMEDGQQHERILDPARQLPQVILL